MINPDRLKLQVRYGDEQILVVPATALRHATVGVQEIDNLAEFLDNACYRPRWQVEYDPSWRQLVSYIVLRQDQQLFLTERLQAQGEARLHSLYSVGVGGHINSDDEDQPLKSSWRRELTEELSLDWPLPQARPQALINDLSNEVSRDHLGILYVVSVPPGGHVAIRETDKMRGRMMDLDLIDAQYYTRLESWSQLVLNFLQKAR